MSAGRLPLDTDGVTHEVIGAAIEVHRYLGPGMLAHTYEACLEAALRQRGLHVERQVTVPVTYMGVEVSCAYLRAR